MRRRGRHRPAAVAARQRLAASLVEASEAPGAWPCACAGCQAWGLTSNDDPQGPPEQP